MNTKETNKTNTINKTNIQADSQTEVQINKKPVAKISDHRDETFDYALAFKALGDETRLRIIEILSCGELCACDILESFQITQPTLSYHMKILTECGLVNSRKDGSWINYSNNAEIISEIRIFWDKITTGQETCICNRHKKGGSLKCE